MSFWTICLNENGQNVVQEGIEFERTDNPLLGILNAGGIQMHIELPPNFEGKMLKYPSPILNDSQFIDLEYKDVDSPLTLKISTSTKPNRILIQYKINAFLIKEEENSNSRFNPWEELEDDEYTYDSISADRSSALLCSRTLDFEDLFWVNGFEFIIKLDEDCRPIVEFLQSENESDVHDQNQTSTVEDSDQE